MKVSVGAKTDPGRRPNNEDQLAVLDVRRHGLRADSVMVIADGMGGRNFGEQAAAAAVDSVQDALIEMLNTDHDPQIGVADALDSALRKANSRIYDMAARDQESRGMGTTCVAAVVEGDWLYLAHAGDSRAYLLRGGELRQLTHDHSYVAEQVRAGVLTEENARRSRFRNVITRAVGIEPTIAPELTEHELAVGDSLLLCTDGLTNMVGETEIASTLTNATSPQVAADQLVNLANRNGGRDNITVVVARIDIGDRTQRMRVGDLAQFAPAPPAKSAAPAEPKPEPSDRTQRMSVSDLSPSAAVPDLRNTGDRNGVSTPAVNDETATVVPGAGWKNANGVSHDSTPTEPEGKSTDPRPLAIDRRSSPMLRVILAVVSVVAVLSIAVAVGLSRVIAQAGYYFSTSAPYVMKPRPPLPPPPPDLADVHYEDPVLFSTLSVSPDALAWNPAQRVLVAVTETGQVVRLDTEGRLVDKYPLPGKLSQAEAAFYTAQTAAQSSPPLAISGLGAAGQAGAATPIRLFWAVDPQGDTYISDPADKVIRKVSPSGTPLRVLGEGILQDPQALAVSSDATVYVVDGKRLRVMRVLAPAPKNVRTAT